MAAHLNDKEQATSSLNVISFIAILIVAILGGFTASHGQVMFLAFVPILIIGAVIALNFHLLLLITLFGGLVVSGLLQMYIPQLQLLRWAFSASATLLLVHIALQSLKYGAFKFKIDSSIIFWSLCFIAVLFLSTLSQNVDLNTAIVGLKGYLQVWGILFALALLPWKTSYAEKFPIFILLVSLIQIPFVLHQFFVLVPLRASIMMDIKGLVPIDIVSGTFGGGIDFGGANAALTVLCFITGAGLTALWKNKLIALHTFLFLAALVMFPAFINSTKVSVVYFFVVLFVTFFDELLYSPLKFFIKLLAVLLLCLLLAISVISTMSENSNVSSLSELYEYTYGYTVESDNTRDNNLSRSGTIRAWLDPVKPHDFGDQIIGYGIGSSRLIDSTAGQQISSTINLQRETGITAIAAILWETGILGLITIAMLFIVAFHTTTKLKRSYKTPYHRSIFTTLQCALIILFISLGHHNFFILHIGFQTLFVTIFGYIAYWERVTFCQHKKRSMVKENFYSRLNQGGYDYDDFE